MEEHVAGEVLFETRRHASGPYSFNYPPLIPQTSETSVGSFLSWLPLPGVSNIKEKWREYREPQRLRRLISLFASPSGERVAIATANQITILRKDDDFQQPCGFYNCSSNVTFTCGAWSEAHDILGVCDDTDTLYFIKVNGEEISSMTRRQLKLSAPIIDLVVPNESDNKKSYLGVFRILTSDGSFYDIDISKDPRVSVSLPCASIKGSMVNRQFPPYVFCMDYHPDLSLVALVCTGPGISLTSSTTGSYSLSLWRISGSLNLEPLYSTQFEGLYSRLKSYVDLLTYPKLLFSPSGKRVATLDVRGSLVTFNLSDEYSSLSIISYQEKYSSKQSNNNLTEGRDWLNDIVDFTWWSDNILTLAKRGGSVIMFDVLSGVRLSNRDLLYSMPVLERVKQFPRQVFLVESTTRETGDSSQKIDPRSISSMEQVIVDKYSQLDIAKMQWSLMSFSGKSVSEMYDILINGGKYQEALDFAIRHNLDQDEVMKSQWLHSGQGIKDINMFLQNIKDQTFILSECVDRVGRTEDSVRALLAYGLRLTDQYMFSDSDCDYSGPIWDFRLARLKLLQFRDKLETFLGINMGRFSAQDYMKFRTSQIKESALVLAESGKIGALNLLFKRHPYSVAPYMLEILAAIPETIPVQTYGQLLPGLYPPSSIVLREEDWVECEKMVAYVSKILESHESSFDIKTEPISKRICGLLWPSTNELTTWYRNRARTIDSLSGLLENSLSLIDCACQKGISDLQHFREDISYFHQLIYSAGCEDETNFTMDLITWEQLSGYEKFKMMLKGVKEENVVEILQNRALPFMQFQSVLDMRAASFLVQWLKEMALDAKLELCLMVIEEGCREIGRNGFFRNEVEVVDCALQCIYSCTSTDKWNTMSSILSKLPNLHDSEVEGLKKRLELAECHIEAGRLLTLYQVPKPVGFLVEPHVDFKSVKQILRLILSKFVRRLPGRSDNEWANMWRDLQSLQEKAFPFVDLEYILMEFCRGLLKAGKFPLARNYLKGTGSVNLAADKAEHLVIQAAREYFFSASSLACSEIWKAKECLNIFPNSRNVRAEADIIDAITIKLPNLGVNILPMQFRQIQDPMEIIKLAIRNQSGAYLNVDELVEIAKLLGLSSQDDISAVQEAIAREAAVAGDLQLSFDLCLTLAKKGHGAAWDLCAALARGPVLENMDVTSRKQLLGFALGHCDEESIGELLLAWKDLDIEGQCERLTILTGTDPPKFSTHSASVISYPPHSIQNIADLSDWSVQGDSIQEVNFETVKSTLLVVANDLPVDNVPDLDSLLRDNGKMFSFTALRLPWLLKLSQFTESDQKLVSGSISSKMYVNVRTKAVVAILSWLARNGLAPKDNLIASLAKSILTPPVTEGEDVLGCSFLLNLVDAFHGVEIIEEQVRKRDDYNEISSIMNVGMIYSLLHNSGFECEDPAQKRELLLRKFQEKYTSLNSDEQDRIDKTQSSFWREWKVKLEEQKRVADHTRVLEKIIPGVETVRFLSGDIGYMESVVYTLVESVKLERNKILKDVLQLVSTYRLDETKVLQKYLASLLVSEVWTVDEIMAEISNFRDKILACAAESIKTLSLSVYPAVNGIDKQRLACIYALLSDCYVQLVEDNKLYPVNDAKSPQIDAPALPHFYKMVEQECSRVSSIKGLNFKNIAGLQGLNLESFNSEVCAYIDEHTVEALAKLVQTLVYLCKDPESEGLLPWYDVYRNYVLNVLSKLESRAKTGTPFESPENLQQLIIELESAHLKCRSYIFKLKYTAVLGIMKQYFSIILPLKESFDSLSCDSAWHDCLVVLLNFWSKLVDDMQEFVSQEGSEGDFCPKCLMVCLKSFQNLVFAKKVSPSQGWRTLVGYIEYGLNGPVAVEILYFCQAMIFSGCIFEAISHVYSDAVSEFPPSSVSMSGCQLYCDAIRDLPHLYLSIFETILQDLTSSGSLDHPNLHNLLSSLSESKHELENLKMVRHAVWTRMAKISENLELPDHVRVYILELMQFISSRGQPLKAFSAEIEANIVPWEGWDCLERTDADSEGATDHGMPNVAEASTRFANTLVALKSSQLASTISPSIQITPKDLLTVESAVSCFLKVCEVSNTGSHCDCLIAILGEWEGLFPSGRDEANPAEASDAGNNWSSDDWDEGWESFQEETLDKELKKENTLVVHPLHACWLEIFQKLVQLSRFKDLLKLIDRSMANTTGILLNDNDTLRMSQTTAELDCFAALKMVLLLPYNEIQLQCLDSVEDKLKQVDISDAVSRDIEFLILALHSGIVTTIITKPSYGTTFSYMCYIVGNLSRQCQEDQLPSLEQRRAYEPENEKRNIVFVFRKIIFPCFIAELVKADQHVLAGILVTKFMHTNASLSLMNVAEASLRKYLEMQQRQVLQDYEFTPEDMDLYEHLINTVARLKGRVGNIIQTALSLIPVNVR